MRKASLVLPLILALLATLFFYGFGGGSGDKATTASQPGVQGINMTLPSPQPAKGKAPDKQGYYRQADIDSERKAELRKTDPSFITTDTEHVLRSPGMMTLSKTDADRKADQLLQQVEQLKRSLAARQLTPTFPETHVPAPDFRTPDLSAFRPKTPASGDPELDRIDGVLEKLIRVQHPEGIKTDSTLKPEPPLLVTIADDGVEREQGFIDITDNITRDSLHADAIPAEISSDQTITAGSSVELRITAPVKMEGHAIPKNQILRGVASLNGERLNISISSIRIGQTILPVALQAYDLDGLAGVRIPGAIIRDASKESADQAINSLATASTDPSLGAQAANAGLQFARSIAAKKVRLVQVAVPAGYQVLLRNVHR
jgi:conjugative transposon TraM protein